MTYEPSNEVIGQDDDRLVISIERGTAIEELAHRIKFEFVGLKISDDEAKDVARGFLDALYSWTTTP